MKSKKQLRSEAVDRLTRGRDGLLEALIGDGYWDNDRRGDRDALVALLTDDDESDEVESLRRNVTRWHDKLIRTEQELKDLNDEYDALESDNNELKGAYDELKAFASRLESAADSRENLDVFGTGYTPCPEDRDGKCVHPGDHVTLPDGAWADVVAVGRCLVVFLDDEGLPHIVASDEVRHDERTVEELLHEMCAALSRVGEPGEARTRRQVIEEYATLISERGSR